MLFNVWAIKKQCSLLDFYSNGEEGGDNRLLQLLAGPLRGCTDFDLVFLGSQPKCLQSKPMWKGREKGVCVHACSHEPLGWRLAAAPAQRWGLKGCNVGGHYLLLLSQTCIQASSRDVWFWWWCVLGTGWFLGGSMGWWVIWSISHGRGWGWGVGLSASAAHNLLHRLGDYSSFLLPTSCGERLSLLLISTLMWEVV